MGRLVRVTLDFLAEILVPDLPSQLELSQLVDLKANVFSASFLAGRPAKNAFLSWPKKARKLMRHILVGRDEQPRDNDHERSARRIHDYFFRNLDTANGASFFERARLPHSEPCSPGEIAGEISWLVRRLEHSKKDTHMVWVSGG